MGSGVSSLRLSFFIIYYYYCYYYYSFIFYYIFIYIGVRGCAPGTAYGIPARVGVWLVRDAYRGRLSNLGLSRRRRGEARHRGAVFFEVRSRGRGPHGCVLLTEIYKMSRRT